MTWIAFFADAVTATIPSLLLLQLAALLPVLLPSLSPSPSPSSPIRPLLLCNTVVLTSSLHCTWQQHAHVYAASIAAERPRVHEPPAFINHLRPVFVSVHACIPAVTDKGRPARVSQAWEPFTVLSEVLHVERMSAPDSQLNWAVCLLAALTNNLLSMQACISAYVRAKSWWRSRTTCLGKCLMRQSRDTGE